MNYRKLATQYFDQKSNNHAHVAVALVAGLAAGAVISILFAPDRGVKTREKIASGTKNIGYSFEDRYNMLKRKVFGIEDTVEHKVPHFKHAVAKKSKSSVKDILENAHENGQVQEGQG